MKPIVIIPTYNEILNIVEIIKEIKKRHEDLAILFVDDNSKDGTREAILEAKKEFKNIYLLERPQKLGLASAYIDGFKYAIDLGFNAFIQMDADFSHNPCYLSTILEKLNDYDVVIGSRNIKNGKVSGWGPLRNFISKGGSLYSKVILNCPINDLTGGFNAYKLEILNKIGLDSIISKGYCFQIEMKYRAYKNNAKIIEIPIVFEDRKFGKSKMSKAIFFEALLNVIKIKLGN